MTVRILHLARRLLREARTGYEIGAAPSDKGRLALHPLTAALCSRLGIGELPTNAEICAFGRRAPLRIWNESDSVLLREIFCEEEYRLDSVTEPELVLDLGCNIGVSTLYFALKYPHARIIGVEAEPANFWKLEANLRGWSGRAQAIFAAAAATDGPVLLNRSRSSVSASLKTRGSGDAGSVQVPGLSFRTLVDRVGAREVGLLKFDIEGAEWDVFEHSAAHQVVKSMVGEYHEDLAGRSVEEFVALWPGFEVQVRPLRKHRYLLRGARPAVAH